VEALFSEEAKIQVSLKVSQNKTSEKDGVGLQRTIFSIS
jgi:hypothetical protein